MPDLPDKNQSDNPPPRRRPRKLSHRERYGEHWIAQLKKLPEPIFRECVRRLINRETAQAVAMWITEQPDRGGIQHLSYGTVRIYVQCLRKCVIARDGQRAREQRAIGRAAKQIREERIALENTVAIEQAQNDAAGNADPATLPIPPVQNQILDNAPVAQPAARDRADAEPPSRKQIEKEIRDEVGRITGSLTARRIAETAYVVGMMRVLGPLTFEKRTGIPVAELTRIMRELNRSGTILAQSERVEAERAKATASAPHEDFATIDGGAGKVISKPLTGKSQTSENPDSVNLPEAIDELNPAQYDKTLHAAAALSELMDLDRQLAAHPAPPAGESTEPRDSRDGQE